MHETTVLPIALLYTDSRASVDGATRFQKLVFLAQEETALDGRYEFRPDRFGPYSPGLASTLDLLVRRGHVERTVRTNEVGNEKHGFGLTDSGVRIARALVEKDEFDAVFRDAMAVKEQFNDWTLDRLLRYVYNRYPDYASETELDLGRLLDPDTESQFLDPDTGTDPSDFVGPGPEHGLEMNSTAEDAFPSS